MKLVTLRRTRLYKYKLYVASAIIITIIVFIKTKNKIKEENLTSEDLVLKNKYEDVIKDYERKIIPGLGNEGKPAILDGEEKKRGEEALKTFALNTVLSDRLPLDRPLQDYRHESCKREIYNPTLTSSVVIIFFNELFSVILRTVWSVINRTPNHLLHEIILVNDGSDNETLKGQLDYYIATRLKHHSVLLLHLPSRTGLIRARLQGARKATGDVLVFLDAHCEVTDQWLEPMLQRIEEKRTVVAIPIIDVIEADTFAYSTNNADFQIGGFTWSGHFTWIDIPEKYKNKPVDPVPSPTMAGGLFAMNRMYFWEVGSYDELMDGWGGENLEMSFRVWQCGGVLETIPCSRVGHVFRDFHPYSFPQNKDTHGINTARLAHVWMDHYAELFFLYVPSLKNNDIIGDITHRKLLRKKLRCKNFSWYLSNVYPQKFIPNENADAFGQVKTMYNMCLDNLQLAEDKVGPLGLYQCHPYLAMSQYFTLSARGELRMEHFCAEAHDNNKSVLLTQCHNHQKSQYWKVYRNGTIYNPFRNLCLSSEGVAESKGVIVESCQSKNSQKWTFTTYNNSAVLI